MKKLLALILTFTCTSAFAGGISGGGGGTTNPRPTDTETVAAAVYQYGGPAILAWAKAQEAVFSRMPAEQRAHSPFRKLFLGEKTIYDVLRETKVELRFNEPCRDANGEAKDGSVHASEPGAVCLSPFTMAPKLNDMNVEEETIALLVHELSHQLGTNENEAEEIQWDALYAMDQADMIKLVTKPAQAHQDVAAFLNNISLVIDNPTLLRADGIDSWTRQLIDFARDFSFDYNMNFAMLRPNEAADVIANSSHFNMARDYLCANDEKEEELIRQDCSERFAKGMNGKEEVTALEYISRSTNISEEFLGPEYKRVILRRPYSIRDLAFTLREVYRFLDSTRLKVKAQAEAQIEIVRK